MDMFRLTYSEEELSNGTLIPNYTKWRTWKRGLDAFYLGIIYFFSPVSAIISWFFISVMISLFIVLNVRKYPKSISISACLAFLALILCIAYMNFNFTYTYSKNLYWNYLGILSSILFFISFSIIAARIGLKIGTIVTNKSVGRISALFLIGLGVFMHNLQCVWNKPYWYMQGVGNMIRASSCFKNKTIYNESFVISIIIMLISIIMGYKYWVASIKNQDQLESVKS